MQGMVAMAGVFVFLGIVAALFCVVLAALIASRKNRSKIGWAAAALVLGPLAIVILSIGPDLEKEVRL